MIGDTFNLRILPHIRKEGFQNRKGSSMTDVYRELESVL